MFGFFLLQVSSLCDIPSSSRHYAMSTAVSLNKSPSRIILQTYILDCSLPWKQGSSQCLFYVIAELPSYASHKQVEAKRFGYRNNYWNHTSKWSIGGCDPLV